MDGPVATRTVTEVRCEEKSKGGLKYEVIISEPVLVNPPVTYRNNKPGSPKQQSVEDIDKKLRAAEERRVSLEASKLAILQAQLDRIEVTSRKREEKTTQFIQQTKETLGSKMEVIQYNREAILSDLKAKLRDHEKRIEMVRNNKERLSMHEDETASSG